MQRVCWVACVRKHAAITCTITERVKGTATLSFPSSTAPQCILHGCRLLFLPYFTDRWCSFFFSLFVYLLMSRLSHLFLFGFGFIFRCVILSLLFFRPRVCWCSAILSFVFLATSVFILLSAAVKCAREWQERTTFCLFSFLLLRFPRGTCPKNTLRRARKIDVITQKWQWRAQRRDVLLRCFCETSSLKSVRSQLSSPCR